MFINTVEELLSCFNIIPDKIVYLDNRNNVQDVVYSEFVEEYGNRKLVDFNVDGVERAIHIEIC